MLCLSIMHAMINDSFFFRHWVYVLLLFCMSNILKKNKYGVFIFLIVSADLNYLTGKPKVDFVELSHDKDEFMDEKQPQTQFRF